MDEFGLRCGTKGPLPNGEPGQQAWQSLKWCFTLGIVSMKFSALEGNDLESENVTQIGGEGYCA